MKKEQSTYSIKDNFTPYLSKYTDNPIKQYIENRVLDQIDWYNKKSTEKQFYFKRLMIASIIINACIPVLTLLSDLPCGFFFKVIISIASSTAAVISSIITLCRFQELWTQYRSNCEILQSVLHRYFTKSGEFKNLLENEAFDLLVTSCENYLTKEFQAWQSLNAPKSDNQSSTGS